jgi:hypothetical protein
MGTETFSIILTEMLHTNSTLPQRHGIAKDKVSWEWTGSPVKAIWIFQYANDNHTHNFSKHKAN